MRMHPDLSRHLHSPECLDLINKLTQCRKEHPFGKFLGACNDLDTAMNKCLKKERLERRALNKIKSEQMIKKARSKGKPDLSFLDEDNEK